MPIPQNLPPAAQPLPQNFLKAAAFLEEGIVSSRLLLEEKIEKFHFEEEKNPKASLINLLDVEGESDRNFGVRTLILVIAYPDNSSDEEEDSMALNKGNKSLRELMAARGKESTSKVAPKSQVPSNLPLPFPQVPTDLGLKPNLDLKKKRPAEMLEEGEVGRRKGTKRQKVTQDPRDKRSQSVNS